MLILQLLGMDGLRTITHTITFSLDIRCTLCPSPDTCTFPRSSIQTIEPTSASSPWYQRQTLWLIRPWHQAELVLVQNWSSVTEVRIYLSSAFLIMCTVFKCSCLNHLYQEETGTYLLAFYWYCFKNKSINGAQQKIIFIFFLTCIRHSTILSVVLSLYDKSCYNKVIFKWTVFVKLLQRPWTFLNSIFFHQKLIIITVLSFTPTLFLHQPLKEVLSAWNALPMRRK